MWDIIFRTGKQVDGKRNERVWTEADLDQLALSVDVPLVVNHPEDENQVASFGVTAELRRDGGNLMARYKDVPVALQKLISGGLALGKSVAIDGKTMRLKHIGILGNNREPAVAGLGPLTFANGPEQDSEILTYYIKESDMDEKDKKIQQLEQEVAQLKASRANEDLKTALSAAENNFAAEKTAHEATKTEFAKYKQSASNKALQDRVDALVQSGRILPAEKEDTLAFAKAMADESATMTFSKEGKTEQVTAREKYLRGLEARKEDYTGLLHEFAKNGETGGEDDAVDLSKINNFA